MASSLGRSALPPSQPHAATSGAAPAPEASFRNPRRSIMRWESSAIGARDHRAKRGRINGEDQHDMSNREGDKNPHDPEMPIAGRLKPTEQCREPAKLQRFVDGESRQNREHSEHD